MAKKVIKRKSTTVLSRNGGTMSESAFWGMIRSCLRNRTRFWVPRLNALNAAKRSSQNINKRLKWEYMCFSCKQYFSQKEVEIHHSKQAGTLKCANDLPLFVENLFCETGWICLCKNCHIKEHKKD